MKTPSLFKSMTLVADYVQRIKKDLPTFLRSFVMRKMTMVEWVRFQQHFCVIKYILASDMALMKAASMNIIKGGGLEELFDGTKTRGKKEKPNAEEDRERAKSRQIHRSLEHCRFCYANKVQFSLTVS